MLHVPCRLGRGNRDASRTNRVGGAWEVPVRRRGNRVAWVPHGQLAGRTATVAGVGAAEVAALRTRRHRRADGAPWRRRRRSGDPGARVGDGRCVVRGPRCSPSRRRARQASCARRRGDRHRSKSARTSSSTGSDAGTRCHAGSMDPAIARKTWRTLEPVHGAIYFAPQAREEYAALGLRRSDAGLLRVAGGADGGGAGLGGDRHLLQLRSGSRSAEHGRGVGAGDSGADPGRPLPGG